MMRRWPSLRASSSLGHGTKSFISALALTSILSRWFAARAGFFNHRKREGEGRAALRVWHQPDFSAVILDDRLSHQQAQAHSAALGGNERFKHSAGDRRIDAGAVVADAQRNPPRPVRRDCDGHFALELWRIHQRVEGIHEQVQYTLLQQHAIA